MSDLSSVSVFSTASPQLPISWYFDPRIYEIEKRLFFEHGPGYIGHELMIPNVGDYQALDWLGGAQALVRSEHEIELLSNVCRHRQAIMLKGRGTTRNIICPLHRWTYSLDGRLLGAPQFAHNPCLDLAKSQLTTWNGLLFAGQRTVLGDLGQLGVAQELDFSGFVFDRIEVEDYDCNWKTFIEVYLEDYHVEPFHPGLGNFVDVRALQWEFGEWYSVQTCGVKCALARPGSSVYQRWHEQVLRYGAGGRPSHGAIWLTYFPNLMVEWYPHALVVSSLIPRGAQACTNVVEFYYPEDIALFEREFVEAEQAAYRETAIEDAEIIARMTAGRRALLSQGIDQSGPYQSPLEDGMRHFHEFVRRELEPHL